MRRPILAAPRDFMYRENHDVRVRLDNLTDRAVRDDIFAKRRR
jgi:hypothetical protein